MDENNGGVNRFRTDLIKNLWAMRRQGCNHFDFVAKEHKPKKKLFRKQEVGEVIITVIGQGKGKEAMMEFGLSNENPMLVDNFIRVISDVLKVFNKK